MTFASRTVVRQVQESGVSDSVKSILVIENDLIEFLLCKITAKVEPLRSGR